MNGGNLVTTIQGAGLVQNLVRKTLPKINPYEAERVKNILEKESEKVQPIYNSRGKLVEYDNQERRINILI